MNVAEISYKIGKIIQKTEEGQRLLDLMAIIKSKVSNEAWDQFQKLYSSTPKQGLIHYYSINYVYELYKHQQNNEELMPFMRDQLNEMLSVNEFKEASDLALYFAKSVDTLIEDIYLSKMPKNFGGKTTKSKLKRAMQDLYVAVQRTNYSQFVFNNYKKEEMGEFLFLSSEYEKKKSPYPFSKVNRELIGQLIKNEKEKMFLWYNEFFLSIQTFIRQLIFEAHLNLVFELKQEELITNRVRRINKLELFKNKINDFPLGNKGSTIRITDNTQQRFGIINVTVWSLMSASCEIEGFLYPKVDKELFIR
ncbi:TPA: hypothetical protein ACJMKJ_004448 [Bacillus wiedmannii]|nr:hypothetical protein CON30_19310 [Bacillus cereus]